MTSINGNIVIKTDDSTKINRAISEIKQLIASVTGNETYINVIQLDDPLSISPITVKKELI